MSTSRSHKHPHRSRALPRLEPLGERMMLTTFNVISSADTNTGINATTGTLRYVLNQLDSIGGSSNVISFASLPVADFTFTPGSGLPDITKEVDIEGNTASGFTGSPLIPISGTTARLDSGSSGSVIGGLSINKYSSNCINIASTNDSVIGCYIGTDPTGETAEGNQHCGIIVTTSGAGATIGGTSAGAANVIAFNGGPGVAAVPGVTGTTVRFNAIYSNVGPGIDRNDDGVTPNTPDGANYTPVLTSVAGGVIAGTLNATPNSAYIIDFYADLAGDASPTRPQGRDYLTTTVVTTNAAGDAVFSAYYTPFPGMPIFTATSTGASGTTSEFSPPVGYPLAATGATFAATAGVPSQGTVASFTSSDPAATAADFIATISYGDGTTNAAGTVVAAPGGFIVVCSHIYTTANPTTPVMVTITDTVGGSQGTASSLADVVSPLTPISQSPMFVAGTPYNRVVASFADASPQAFPGQFTATINWGDGSASSPGVVSADGTGFDVTGSHTYNFTSTSSVTEPIALTITERTTGATVTANPTATVNPAPITIQMKTLPSRGARPSRERSPPSPTPTRGSIPRSTPPRYTGATDRPIPPARSPEPTRSRCRRRTRSHRSRISTSSPSPSPIRTAEW